MKVAQGTKIKALQEIVSGEGAEERLKAGAVLAIAELGYFGVGQHLAMDAAGNPWVVEEGTIDSPQPEFNEFTVIKDDNV